jgi:signal transduction histidine kinase
MLNDTPADRHVDADGSKSSVRPFHPAPVVLFVDDDDHILKALKRILRREPFTSEFATGGAQALKMLKKKSFQAVVTDMEMPEMDGVDLLKTVSDQYPDTIRLVISAGSDSQRIIDAINKGHIYNYILKPWDDNTLKVAIRRALEWGRLKSERRYLINELRNQNQHLEQLVELRTSQMLAIEQQAEIGRYAAQIVHNLNNPMHSVSAALDLLEGLTASGTLDKDQIRRYVQLATTAACDLKGIISSILLHASEQSFSRRVAVDVNNMIRSEISLFSIMPEFKYKVEKNLDLDPLLPTITGNPIQIKQILDNLIKNALDAMEHTLEKRLTLKTFRQDEMIVIFVADTGEGIQAKHLSRIFLPDFSTKPIGKGTGLGLASVKTMVEAYAGTITVKSTPGKGTTFKVRLPLKEPALSDSRQRNA